MAILGEQEAGFKIADVCRPQRICGMSSATSNVWKAKCGGVNVSQVPWRKALEDENTKLM